MRTTAAYDRRTQGTIRDVPPCDAGLSTSSATRRTSAHPRLCCSWAMSRGGTCADGRCPNRRCGPTDGRRRRPGDDGVRSHPLTERGGAASRRICMQYRGVRRPSEKPVEWRLRQADFHISRTTMCTVMKPGAKCSAAAAQFSHLGSVSVHMVGPLIAPTCSRKLIVGLDGRRRGRLEAKAMPKRRTRGAPAAPAASALPRPPAHPPSRPPSPALAPTPAHRLTLLLAWRLTLPSPVLCSPSSAPSRCAHPAASY
jgi:hypothetical protein